jgi:transcriptional regulator with XRE-family HTH domain
MGDEVHDEEAFDDDLGPQSVLDLATFGRRLRALRVLAGYDRASDFTAVLRSRYGVDVHDRTLYAIERGEQSPTMAFVLACVGALRPPLNWFAPAIRKDVLETLMNPEAQL